MTLNHILNKHIIIKCIVLCIYLHVSLSSFAGVDYRFHTMSPEGGFNYHGVRVIKQDTEGFIWVMMDYNLYRFDGYQYINYNNHFQDSDNPSKLGFFAKMETDTLGRLYVVVNRLLYTYRENNNTFERLSDADVGSLKIDPFNNIWVNTTEGLSLFDPEKKSFMPVSYQDKPVKNYITSLWNVEEQLYAVIGNDIYSMDVDSRKITLLGKLPVNTVPFIYFCDQELWAISRQGVLYRIDFQTFSLKKTYDLFTIPGKDIRALHVDKLGYVWIGSEGGLFIFDPKTGTNTFYQHSESDPFSIPDNSVWTINEDRRGNVWVGTYSGGLCYIDLDEKNIFRSYTRKESPLNHDIVGGFAEDDRYLWIATEGGGINLMDKTTGDFSYLRHQADDNSLAYDNVKTIVYDHKRRKFWISMYRGGLDCYDAVRKTFTHFKYQDKDKNSLLDNNVRTIALEADSGLWVAYNAQTAISFYSFEKKAFEHFYFEDNGYIYDICRDTINNKLWFVTSEELYQMDIKSRKIQRIQLDRLLYGRTITNDRDGNLWIGTVKDGLVRYSVRDSSYHIFDEILNYNNPSIYSICTDPVDHLWVGTNNGLFKYDIDEDKIMRFDKEDGIQGRVFYPLACMNGSDGKLYFGGTNGFTIVDYMDDSYNSYKPKAMITDILINNVSEHSNIVNLAWKQSEGFGKEIVFTHQQVNVGFTFSSDNFLMPSKNRYRYRLKGYNDHWTEVTASVRTAFYTKLPAGDYTIEVLAMNNDGLWGDTPTTLAITRLPSPWFGWQAKVVYSIIFILALCLIVRHYRKQKELKLTLYKEGLEKQKREEIHQAQLQFFTNISHDFRSPLSLMIATLDTLKKEGLKEYYYRILNNNSQRLLKLVNELLLFRTIEAGEMSLHLEESDVNALLTNIASDFRYYAEQQQINFRIDCDPGLPKKIWIDVDIFDRIIVNLLNNAFKFTPEGDIAVATYSDINDFHSDYKYSFTVGNTEDLNNPFGIVIHDTGIGISAESIKQVFERFFKIESSETNQHLGSGIGLALVKGLVLLHKGSITIHSERGKGSDVVMMFPKYKSMYPAKDIPDERKLSKNIDLIELYETDLTDLDAANIADKKILLREERRILVVEDNKDLQRLVTNYLSQYYDVIGAPDGMVAKDTLNDTEIDLIISDIMMPLKDGIALCNEVKSNIDTSHIPVILLTAKTSVDSKLEGVDSGADVYLEKPVNMELLLHTIRNVFKRREQLKEYYSKTYFANAGELEDNQLNNKFLKRFIAILEERIDESDLDVNYIASQLSMSRSKLYLKIKSITGKTIVEFILGYRLRKAAQLIAEGKYTIREIQFRVGIESPSYFTRAFKKEFGETPTSFASKQKK